MASTLQLVETTALATVNYDFNTSTGVGNPNLVRTSFGVGGAFALGAPAFQSREFEPPHRDGGLSTFTRNGITVISWRNRFYTSPVSYDDLAASFGTLSQLFNRGGTLKWIADGSANPARYRDFLPSPAPALLDGKPIELLQTILQGDTPEGITLALRCQPFWYEAELDSDVNKLRNATFLFGNGNARPTEWFWDNPASITAEAISTANEWFEFSIATTGTRNFQQSTFESVAASGDVFSFSYYAHVASGTNCRVRAVIRYLDAAGGVLGSESVSAQTTLTTTEQRISVTSSAAPASTSRVRATVRFENSTAAAVTPRLRKGQLEKASAVTTFRIGTETIFADPAGDEAPRCTIAAVATGVVTEGTHSVRTTFANVDGLETAQGIRSAAVNIAANQKYSVTAIALGPPGTTKRRLYMTIAGDTGNHLFAMDVADNTSTTASLNVADGSLGAAAPTTWTWAGNGRVFPAISVGQAPTEWSFEIEGDGSAIYQAVIAGRSSDGTVGRHSLLDYMNSRRVAQMEDATPLGTGVTVDTNLSEASGGAGLDLPSLTDEFRLTGRIQFTTLLECLRGRWDVWLRFGSISIAVNDPKWQLRWGASTTTPAPFANAVVIPEGVGAAVFGDLFLGQVVIPDEGTLTGVVLEPWAGETVSATNLRTDAIMLVPADEQSSIVGAFGGGAQQSWVPSQFVTPVTSPGAGTAATNGNRLDTSADNLGTQPNAGLAFSPGSHSVEFDATIHHASSSTSHDTQAEYFVRNVTDGVDTVSALGTLVTGKAPKDVQETVVRTFTAVSGKLYQLQVRVETLGNVSDYITANSFKDTFLPVLSGTSKFKTDPERTEVSTVTADGSLISPLGVQGPVPLRLGPGLAVIYVSPADLPSPGFDVPLTTLGRWAKVRTRHKPRYF